MQLSTVHVYLTYPFVVSWSMLEAMSAGCVVVGSDTVPIREFIRDKENGLLVDFFSPDQIANAADRVLQKPAKYKAMRAEARRTIVEGYDFKSICLPRQLELVESFVTGKLVNEKTPSRKPQKRLADRRKKKA